MNVRMTVEYDGTDYRGWQVPAGRVHGPGNPGGRTGRAVEAPGADTGVRTNRRRRSRAGSGGEFRVSRRPGPDANPAGLDALTPDDITIRAVRPRPLRSMPAGTRGGASTSTGCGTTPGGRCSTGGIHGTYPDRCASTPCARRWRRWKGSTTSRASGPPGAAPPPRSGGLPQRAVPVGGSLGLSHRSHRLPPAHGAEHRRHAGADGAGRAGPRRSSGIDRQPRPYAGRPHRARTGPVSRGKYATTPSRRRTAVFRGSPSLEFTQAAGYDSPQGER